MFICLERGADLHTAQLMPLPLTVSCFSKIRIGFTFLVPANPGSPGKRPLNGCVCHWMGDAVLACSGHSQLRGARQLLCGDARLDGRPRPSHHRLGSRHRHLAGKSQR